MGFHQGVVVAVAGVVVADGDAAEAFEVDVV